MDRNLGMDLVRVTEAAALGSSPLLGRGGDGAVATGGGGGVADDKAAIESMRKVFDTVPIDGTIVIGEGPEDAISMLYAGERVGTGNGPRTDVAVDAIEGPATCATGGYNALAVIAV